MADSDLVEIADASQLAAWAEDVKSYANTHRLKNSRLPNSHKMHYIAYRGAKIHILLTYQISGIKQTELLSLSSESNLSDEVVKTLANALLGEEAMAIDFRLPAELAAPHKIYKYVVIK